MSILVTGATGFLGQSLIPRLLSSYASDGVSAFLLPEDNVPDTDTWRRVAMLRGRIEDRTAVSRAVSGHECVIHLAGLISYWRGDGGRLIQVNVDGTRNVVEACLDAGVRRLIHVSSVGAVGFLKAGHVADEAVEFNWGPKFLYMNSKYLGQSIVEQAVREHGLNAVILNPASIMGPGDYAPRTPHNQLYRMVYESRVMGTFTGGLAVVDVRDVAEAVVRTVESGAAGERYLLVGANVEYADVLRAIAREAGRRVSLVPVPSSFLVGAGALLEAISVLTRRRPLLTRAYGRISGWHTYYSNEKSRRDLGIDYTRFDDTIRDSCRFYEKTFRSV